MLSDVFIWGRWPQCEQHGVHLINVVLALLHVFFRQFKCDKRVFGLYFWKHCFFFFFLHSGNTATCYFAREGIKMPVDVN